MTLPRGPIDVERIIVGVLDDATTNRVHTTLPPEYDYPVGRLLLLPGGAQADGDHEDHRLTRDRVQLEVFGDPDLSVDGKSTARDYMDELAAALINAAGDYGELGVVTAVIAESWPYWLPDPADDGPRYIMTAQVFSHPA